MKFLRGTANIAKHVIGIVSFPWRPSLVYTFLYNVFCTRNVSRRALDVYSTFGYFLHYFVWAHHYEQKSIKKIFTTRPVFWLSDCRSSSFNTSERPAISSKHDRAGTFSINVKYFHIHLCSFTGWSISTGINKVSLLSITSLYLRHSSDFTRSLQTNN